MYFKKPKGTKKVIEELNQTAHRYTVVEILRKEQNISADDLGPAETTKVIANSKEKITSMQLITNADCDKYDTLIKDYDREYLSGINKYPKIFQDTYNLLKGQNKHKKPGQKYPSKVGMALHTVGEENREALVNDKAKRPTYSRCGHNNHIVEKIQGYVSR